MSSKIEIPLFDALRIAEGTPEALSTDAEELKILRTKSAETLKVIAKIKAVFGLDAKVTQ